MKTPGHRWGVSNARKIPVEAVTMRPVGVIETPYSDKSSAPRQARAGEGVRGILRLCPGQGFEDAVSDLEAWSHLWLIFHFDRARGFRPKVLPPRSETKRGVFATRSPHRPNAIGMSVVRLERVEGLCLHVVDLDLLDGTPILDIKPYVRWADCVPGASDGWLGPEAEQRGAARPVDPQPTYAVRLSAEAVAGLELLREAGVELWPRIEGALSLGPRPHAYRRIRPDGDAFRLAVQDFRVRFRVEGLEVEVLEIRSGYRARELAERPELSLHRALEAQRFTPCRGAGPGSR